MTSAPALPARFKLLRRIGEGGMGTVYEAIDSQRDDRVALKLLRSAAPDALVRFKREFRSLQDLHHPNLVTLGELVSEGSQWFFTMELVKGEDFVSWVTTFPSLRPTGGEPAAAPAPFGFDEGRLRSALVQLVQALSALHEAHKVHRDVKPSNVLVTAEGRVVVLDLGLVHDLAPDAGPTMTDLDVVGTPAYMAPEQAASRSVGPAADWYAVGVLLYEALTGELPFSGAPLEVLLRKQKDEPKPPSALVAGLPRDLDELCVRLLRFDPDRRPTADTILAALDATPRATAPSFTSLSSVSLGVPFVGREVELLALQEAYAEARSGRAVAVMVHGESGIGKSCLVRHFVDALSAQDRSLVVLQGRCYQREAVPYKALDGVVDVLARFLGHLPPAEAARFVPTRPGALVQVFPVLRRVEVVAQGRAPEEAIIDPLELRSRAFGAMRELLQRLADRRPLIVVIDDLQWSDADSFALLQEILRPPEEPVMLLIATVRDDAAEGTTMASKLPDEPAALLPGVVRRVDLGRLDRRDARTLVARLVERLAPTLPIDAETLAREADGHPLFIDEIVRHLFLVGASRGKLRLEDALWSRIASLEVTPRRIVEIVAVAGSPVPQDAVCKAVEANPAEFQRLVSFLRVAHLVRTTGTRERDAIECFHGRIREAVLENLDAEARRLCHWRIAVALESSPNADVDLLAVHWLGAGDTENAGKHMLAAADRAASTLAFERAAGLYERGLQLRLRSSRRLPRPEERSLQTKLADALANTGRGAEAARVYRAAAIGANAAETLDLERRAAHQLLLSGRFDEGFAAIQSVLASIGMRLPEARWAALVALLFWRLLLRLRGLGYKLKDASLVSARDLTRIDVCFAVASSLSLVDPIRGQLFQQRNILLSLRLGEPSRVARALATEVSYLGMAGGPGWKRTQAVDAESQRIAEQVGDPTSVGWRLATSGVAHYLAGKFEEGLARCERAETIFVEQCAGAAWETFTMRLFGLQCLMHLGRLRELSVRQPVALRLALERGDLYAATNLRIGYPNLAWLVTGEPDRARREATEAMQQWSKGGFHLEHYYGLMALTNADLYEGLAREAHARVTAQWPALRRSLIMRVQMVRTMAWHLRGRAAIALAATDASARPGLLRSAARDARAIAGEKMPWAQALATSLRAGIARLEGDAAGAAALLERATREADHAKLAFVAVAARHALGTCRGGAEGERLASDALAAARAEGIKEPARLIEVMVPGFGV